MTSYDVTLVAGLALLVWGAVRLFTQLTGGTVGISSIILMAGGGAALVAADNYSPEGVRIEDVMPALMNILVGLQRLVF